MRVIATLLLGIGVALGGEDWALPRCNLANTGVSRNKGPKKEPKVVWKREEENGEISTGAALALGKLVYGIGHAHVGCRWAADGRVSWDKVVKQQVKAWPAIVGKNAYFGGQDHMHYLIVMDNGNEPNSVDAEGGIVGFPAVTDQHYCHGSTDGYFYMMNATDTRIRWKKKVGPVHHGTAMARTTVYIANRIGVLYAFEIKKGKERWQHKTETDTVSAPILVKSRVLLPVKDKIVSLSAKKGGAAAIWPAPGITRAPAVDKTTLYYPNDKGEIVMLALKNGKETGRIKAAPEAITTPLIVASKVIYGAAGPLLFAVDPNARTVLWTVKGEDDYKPPIVADGAVYVGAGSTFYCLR